MRNGSLARPGASVRTDRRLRTVGRAAIHLREF